MTIYLNIVTSREGITCCNDLRHIYFMWDELEGCVIFK